MAALNAKRRFAVAAFAPGLLNVALLAAAFALPAVLAIARAATPCWRSRSARSSAGVLQVVAQWPALRAIGYAGRPALVARPRRAQGLPAHRPADVRHRRLLRRPRPLAPLPLGARHRRAELLLVGDAPLRLPAGHLRDGALDRGAAVALDARGAGAIGRAREDVGARHGPRDVRRASRRASRCWSSASRSSSRSSSAARSTRAAAHETARALVWQGGAIWTVAAVRQTVPAFYALGDTRTPVARERDRPRARSSPSPLGLRGPMGHVGISVAVAGSSAVQMVLLLAGLRWRMGTVRGRRARPIGGPHARRVGRGVRGRVGRSPACVTPEGPAEGVARALPGLVGLPAFATVFVTRRLGAAVARARGDPRAPSPASALRRGRSGRHSMKPSRDQRRAWSTRSSWPAPSKPTGLPRAHVCRGRLRGPLERRQVEPAQRDDAAARRWRGPAERPGCTRQLNVFDVHCADGLQVNFVDLPGYGWARRSKSERGEWQGMIEGYLPASGEPARRRHPRRRAPRTRGRRAAARRVPGPAPGRQRVAPPLEIDLVATKIDKLGAAGRKPALDAVKKAVGGGVVGFSAVTGDGREALWARIRHAVL